ncbi:Aste57867_9456 [Aphanomyces stellatus]|uniref:Aste57867_9456 protein n=1 Tax=Aphanomyces stellatus TaxID=120398 RepID=A0A485KN10_9STRA|nr:hypothetical protein As57867_009420 [Aphanomyces stellatus]VFT86335.1 Aste57867_9456 [Aphanomyces stellatus]
MDNGSAIIPPSECIVCSTGLSVDEITVSKRLVAQLGMRWDDDLHAGVTHLLAIVVGSEKYTAAMAANMKVVKMDWLKACSRQSKVVSTEPYELGALEGLCICTTGLYVEDREKVQELCETAGAIYHPDLNFGTTTHLLAQHPEGEKYKTAVAYGIPVVTVDWIVACVEAKAYKDEGPYRVKELEDDSVEDNTTCLKLNDQLAQCLGGLDGEPPGTFFDGCVFWLSGFPPEVMQKMKLLVRFGMGTRFDAYNSSVTHVVADFIGNSRRLQDTNGNVDIVSATWLIDSCLAMTCMQEDLYPPPLIRPEYATPTKAIVPVVAKTTLVEKLKSQLPEKTTPLEPQERKLFSGYMFLLVYTDKLGSTGNLSLKTQIKAVGGWYREINTMDPRILQPSDLKRITHIVLGHGCELPDGMFPSLCDKIPNANLTTELWLHCCLQENRIFPRRRHPLFLCSADTHASVFPQLPLPCFQTMTACISMFLDVERAVVSCLLRLAGANVTLKFSKRNSHLVCGAPEGPKYEKAVEWKLAIVDARWLITSISAAAFIEYPSFTLREKKRKRHETQHGDSSETVLPSSKEEAPTVSISQDGHFASQDSVEGGALTQLENLLGDMGGEESCSLDYRDHRHRVAASPPEERSKPEVNPQFFEDSQAAEPDSEMVLYADSTQHH